MTSPENKRDLIVPDHTALSRYKHHAREICTKHRVAAFTWSRFGSNSNDLGILGGANHTVAVSEQITFLLTCYACPLYAILPKALNMACQCGAGCAQEPAVVRQRCERAAA